MPADGSARTFPGLAVCLLVPALGLLAWGRRFVQDDAFISFRYARNLAEGQGLVFNPGEHVEGYTNFLWTLLMAAGLRLHVPIVFWSQLLGLLCCCASLAITFLLAKRLLHSAWWALIAVVVLGLNFSFSVFGTGGLETSLATMTVLLAAYLAQVALDREQLRGLDLASYSLVAALALLTRLDSAVLLAAPAGMLVWRLLRFPHSDLGAALPRFRLVLALMLPAGGILGAWFLWKLSYYGSLFPLTFSVKTGGRLGPTLQQGARFLYQFARSYWLPPMVLLVLVSSRRLIRVRGLAPLMITCLLWLAYVVRVGGDFMEFRMLVPMLPFWTLCVLAVPAVCLPRCRLTLVAAGLVVTLAVAGSYHHQTTFKNVAGIESIRGLSRHLTAHRWERVGEVLGEVFRGHEDEVMLAVTAAGVIPYHSRLRTIDMLGLSDTMVAAQGIPFKTQPGHERIASFHYLLRRGVNLVVGHPLIVPGDWRPDPSRPLDAHSFRLIDARPIDLPPTARVLEIPLDQENKLLALYLVPNPQVEKAIQDRAWQTYRLP
jgi:arabinofuranosyltransferase